MNTPLDRSIPPAIHSFGPLVMPPEETMTFPSDITLHMDSGGTSEVCRLSFIIPGGEAESPRPGIAQEAMRLLSEGSELHTGEQTADILEYNGAWIKASASTHHSVFTLWCLNEKFASLLPLFVEMLTTPAYPADITAALLGQRASRVSVNREKVDVIALETMLPLAYGENNPLAAVETPESIVSITPQEMHDFHTRCLDPSQMHVYFSGLLTDAVRRPLIELLESIPADARRMPLAHIEFPEPPGVPRRMSIHKPNSLQSAVRFAIPAPGRRHPDFVDVRNAVMGLGGYFGSRLMLKIREEKGLTYGISASLIGYKDRSFISISTQTDSSYVEAVIASVQEEIERMKDPASYTPDEVDRLSKFLISNLASVLDTPFSRSDFNTTHILSATPANYFALQERSARMLTAEALAESARRHFDLSNLITVTVGK